ncbi:MAG TPA: tetratricopeptide repeat protein, partial [Methylomirabilota bacterium]|nr:tetratricopeptide repeat protein [Methylomirabilota bacterium]
TRYTTVFHKVDLISWKWGPFLFFNLVGLGVVAGFIHLARSARKFGSEWIQALICGGAWVAGAAFYLYMALAGMTNPPLQWGYPRTVTGFFHAFTRGQYEKINPTFGHEFPSRIFSETGKYIDQIGMYVGGVLEEFNLVYVVIGLVPFLFFRRMQKRERAWLIGLTAIFLCLSLFLLNLLNPAPDRQSRDLNRVFFTASHVMIAMGIGYGLTFLGATLAIQYERFRRPVLLALSVAAGIALFCTAVVFQSGDTIVFRHQLFDLVPSFDPVQRAASLWGLGLALAAVAALLAARTRAPIRVLLVLFALMPFRSVLSHWSDNEQRGHLFGFWFGHDMFTPAPEFKGSDGQPLYPNMAKDAVLFGGTDPGRFNPTYMIFCESFIPPSKRRDPEFDRRDVYLITQNALADGTYLQYIRAHYNRSAQIDPYFFSELLRGPKERELNLHTNLLARMMLPVDRFFTDLGDRIEFKRRAGSSLFTESDFVDMAGFATKLRPGPQQDPLSKYLYEHLSPETQRLLTTGGPETALRAALARDLNHRLRNELTAIRQLDRDLELIHATTPDAATRDARQKERIARYQQEQHQLFTPERFAHVNLSDYVKRFIDQNPHGHSLVRLNRLLLEEAYPKELAKSPGGVYPDREIITPSNDDSQRCFQEYLADAQRRLAAKQLKPGEDVRIVDNRVQVSGQIAVMAINGLLTKVIFDKNPNNEFYVEESFPLDWMYPHLTPFGIIMKINREPLVELSEDVVRRDHEFWSQYQKRMIGDLITYDTTISNVCDFAERTYIRRDYKNFKGDPKFFRDSDGQKAFSKLRSSIAGVYAWRLQNAATQLQQVQQQLAQPGRSPQEQQQLIAQQARLQAEQARMLKEAEFAFKQAYALCPYSPEAIFRYINLLAGMGRLDEALMMVNTSVKLDPFNGQLINLQNELMRYKRGQASTWPGFEPTRRLAGVPQTLSLAWPLARPAVPHRGALARNTLAEPLPHGLTTGTDHLPPSVPAL